MPSCRGRWIVGSALLAGALLAVTLLAAVQTRALEASDDAFISLRIARNMAAGHGVVFNADGPPSEAASSFLFTALLAGAHAAGAPLIQAALALNLLFLLGTLVLLALALARWPGRGALWAPPLLVCLTVTHLNAVNGLETTLAGLLLLGAVVAMARGGRGQLLAGVLLGLLCMTRPEGPIYVIALAALRGWTALRRRAAGEPLDLAGLLQWLIPFVVLYAPYTVWRLATFGQLLPGAYHAKAVFFPDAAAKLGQGALYLGTVALAEPLLPASIAAGLWAWRAGDAGALRPTLLLLVATQALFMVLSGGDWPHMFGMGRFLYPVLPLCLWLLADAGALLWQRGNRRALSAAVGALALVSQVDLVALTGVELDPHFHMTGRGGRPALTRQALARSAAALSRAPARQWWRQSTAPFRDARYTSSFDARAGRWLRDRYGEQTAVAAIQAGQFAYWSRMPFFDLFGLATPGVHRLRDDGPGMMARLGADNVRLVAFYRWGDDMHNRGVVQSGALWRAGFGLKHVLQQGTFRAFVVFQRGHSSAVDPVQALTVPLADLPTLAGPAIHVEIP